MINPFRKRGIALILAMTASSAFAQVKPRLVLLELAPLDPEVSRAVSRQLTTSLAEQLTESFAIVPDAQVDGLRAGVEKPPDISAALAQLAEAKQQLANGQNKPVQKTLKSVKAI